MTKLKQYKFNLTIKNSEIVKIINSETKEIIDKLKYPLTSKNYKIYIVSDNNQILYIGTTKNSIKNRIRSGMKAKGVNGYHGYKWKHLDKVTLSVWDFENLNQAQIENIEAELVFLVRSETERWPEFQNEIHFNNSFVPNGKIIANEIYNQLLFKK